jgi:hypothetical protein
MARSLLILSALVWPALGWCQVIPAERLTDWSGAGARTAFVAASSVDITDFGADPTGVTSCNSALQAAMAALAGPGQVHFPPGLYLFSNTIVPPDSIILHGDADANGQPLARLLLAAGEEQDGIRISGSETVSPALLTLLPQQGQRFLLVDQPQLFQPGQLLRLEATDDADLVTSSWSLGQTGQLVEVTTVNGDTLHLARPMRRTYGTAPIVLTVSPRRQVHVRCLLLDRTTATTSQTCNILMRYAQDCTVDGVRSERCNYAHINLFRTTCTTVRNSHFTQGHSYGAGGKAYGVLVDYGSGDNLVLGNTFDQLRHALIIQAGANGNVFAYNRSENPFWSQFPFPSNAAGDLVMHGNYPYLNLFEGNVVQNIVIDNSHGINGPYNTLFRNRAELYGIFMSSAQASNFQNLIGNQVSYAGSTTYGLYNLQGTGHFAYGNQVHGDILPAGTGEPTWTTLWDHAFGPFYSVISSVPPIRTDNWQSTQPLIEAAYRWAALGRPSTCADVEYDIGTGQEGSAPSRVVASYYDPVGHRLVVTGPLDGTSAYRVMDILGRSVASGNLPPGGTSIALPPLPMGTYLLHMERSTQRFVLRH